MSDVTNFVPGPWKMADNGSAFVYSLNKFGSNRFWCAPQSSSKGGAEDQELIATARLIHSAPDMYKALSDIFTEFDDELDYLLGTDMAYHVKSVLAKARGEAGP